MEHNRLSEEYKGIVESREQIGKAIKKIVTAGNERIKKDGEEQELTKNEIAADIIKIMAVKLESPLGSEATEELTITDVEFNREVAARTGSTRKLIITSIVTLSSTGVKQQAYKLALNPRMEVLDDYDVMDFASVSLTTYADLLMEDRKSVSDRIATSIKEWELKT